MQQQRRERGDSVDAAVAAPLMCSPPQYEYHRFSARTSGRAIATTWITQDLKWTTMGSRNGKMRQAANAMVMAAIQHRKMHKKRASRPVKQGKVLRFCLRIKIDFNIYTAQLHK
jgi:hypothetical protein